MESDRSPSFAPWEVVDAPLIKGAVYEGGPSIKDEPIQKLLGVGNQGGIRLKGHTGEWSKVVLYSTHEEDEWPDTIDDRHGHVTYYGDCRSPGKAVFAAKGNAALNRMFERGFDLREDRELCPPFFVFSHVRGGAPPRTVRFRGLAVPGSPVIPPEEWLVAKWFGRAPERFQNVVLRLSLLATLEVDRQWVEGLDSEGTCSPGCPIELERWIELGWPR